MRTPRLLFTYVFLLMSVVLVAQTPTPGANAEGPDLSGLWKAKRHFEPFGPTPLIILRSGGGYWADMLGWFLPIRTDKGELTFVLPNGQGSFRGKVEGQGTIVGHWLGARTPLNGLYASPIELHRDGAGRWRGVVRTLEDRFTLFLLLKKEGPDSWTAVLRNPQRDIGGQLRVTRLIRQGSELRLLGTRSGKEEPVAQGGFDPDREAITLVIANRGGSYDFAREGDESDFYPRGKNPGRYVYRPPLALDDGWPTGTLEAANIDRPAMERFIQRLIETPMDSEEAPQVHGFLLARHGRLLLEEYFHGEHRESLHQTRSAAKSITSVAVGAVIHDRAPLNLASPVYQIMNGGSFPPDLDPQNRNMTLEHLLTMSSGYFCDDTNEQAPGNEDKMWEQNQEPDFYRYTLKVPLATPPGENAVYCSVSPNLALGMLGRARKEFPLYSFDRLVAKPLQVNTYVWPLDPAGNPYGGGGLGIRLRDFMKFGQLLLNEGRWNGRQILSREFAQQSITPQYHLRRLYYGYLWWIEDLPYKDRKVRAFMALGAGGNNVIGIPELGLVIAFVAGNYSTRTQGKLREAVPRYVLPAVREPGDDKNAPVVEREYTNPYGRSSDGSRVRTKK